MYHKYKVLEDFVFLNGRIEYHGDTLNFDEGAYNHDKIFIDSLVLHGFLEVIEEKPKTVWDLKFSPIVYPYNSIPARMPSPINCMRTESFSAI